MLKTYFSFALAAVLLIGGLVGSSYANHGGCHCKPSCGCAAPCPCK